MSDAAVADEEIVEDVSDRDEGSAQLDLLKAENERLRELYGETRQSNYQRTALGLLGLGLLAVAGAAVFPDVRRVLVVLGAIGLFGSLLTYYLTPERFVAADVAERVYDAMAGTEAAIVAELGLSAKRVYLPAGEPATLYVPQNDDDPIPAVDTMDGPFVVTDEARGLALTPTGARLFDEFERTLSGGLSDRPATLAEQVTDALVETFEFADSAEQDLDATDGRLTVALRGAAYPDGFDTPPASLLAVGMATGLDTSVRTDVTPAEDADYTVTCRWDPDAVEADETAAT